MKKPFFFERIHLSIVTKSFYEVVIKEHFMKAFLYLLLLSLLCIIPYASLNTFEFNKYTKIAVDILNDQKCPDFVIDKEGVTFKSNDSYAYEDQKNNEFIIIIDPDNSYSINDLASFELGYMFTPKSMIIWQTGLEPQAIDYSAFWLGVPMSKNLLIDYLQMFQPLILIFVFLGVLFLGVLYILFLSLFALSMAYFSKNLMRLDLSFSQTYKVAIYSMTGPLLLLALIMLLPITISFDILFFLFVFANGIILTHITRYLSQTKRIS